MNKTTYARKLDSMGRIMLPSKLREEMGLIPGETYEFFTHTEGGRNYICIDCGSNSKLDAAIKLVQEHGMKVVE